MKKEDLINLAERALISIKSKIPCDKYHELWRSIEKRNPRMTYRELYNLFNPIFELQESTK